MVKILTRPVHRGPQPLHLLQDYAAIMLFPLPNPLHESFAGHIAPALALRGELPFHHQLRRNTGMVRSRQPQRRNPAHALPPDDDVDFGVLEHVPHVQVPGHIRRRKRQRERRLLGACRGCVDVKQLLLDPILGPARLDGARLIGLGQIVRHAYPFARKNVTPLILQDCRRRKTRAKE